MAEKEVWWVRPDRTPPPLDFKIIIDTREQVPFFAQSSFAQRGTLKSGDYSIFGHESEIAIERKSIQDLYGSCAQGRARFEREFERLAQIPTAILLVEGDWCNIVDPMPGAVRSAMNPTSVEGTILSWCLKYHVLFFPAGPRRRAERLCFRILALWYKNLTAGTEPVTVQAEMGKQPEFVWE
jgi:ERCC4-type nuclease